MAPKQQRIAHFDQEAGRQMTVEVREVTPDEAAQMLKLNTNNRRLSDVTVDAYVRAMQNGEWKFTGDPIRFNKDGEVLDGGHRLHAVCKSGIPQIFAIVSGVPTEYRKVMDQGRGRTARDNLHMEGIVSHANKATIAALLLRWDMDAITKSKIKIQNQQVVNFVLANDDRLHAAVQQASLVKKAIGLSMGAGGALYYKAGLLDVFKANEFFTRLATGAELAAGSPILALRATIVRNKTGPVSTRRRINSAEELFYCVRAWNAFRSGEYIARMQLPQGSNLGPGNFSLN